MFSILWIPILASAFSPVLGVTVSGFEDGGSTLVSAMMMFLGNEDSIYILDKAEMNAAQVNGHPAWGSLWDIKSRKAVVMDIRTNSFCASGYHLPNGSYVTFGGNDAVTTGGRPGSQKNPDGTGAWDALFQDFDGRRSIRILNPCKATDNLVAGNCAWYDQPEQLSMKRLRWYSAAEATAEGRIVIIGGMVTGGYINRFLPNDDPATERGAADPTYEYFPAMDGEPRVLNFIVRTSGLNTYAHTFLMPSGKMLLQANISTTLWDHVTNQEVPLPDMPNGVVRVYPASGATAMLPLTPANNWTPTILFCGGSAMSDADSAWGDYGGPRAAVWNIPASKDCQRITPEPVDGSQPQYVQDDDMLESRTLSQFIILPTGKLLLLNGALNGTGGYMGTGTPYGYSLASGPVLTPAIYDPNAPKGSRWSNQGLLPSTIPRLYHSTAMLLPDGSVLAAGSNPNPDANLTTTYQTEYRADIFYPSYFSAAVRPNPQNLPQTLTYGGAYFDILIETDSFTGNATTAADVTVVNLVRGGFTTHAMNMGQRFMQLNNTYTVNKNKSITLHVSQPPPNPNILQPGPALLFVCINGIPSVGKLVIVGNGVIGPQTTAAASPLPPSAHYSGSGSGSSTDTNPSHSAEKDPQRVPLIAGIASAACVLVLLGVIMTIFFVRRRKRAAVALPEEKAFQDSDSKPTDDDDDTELQAPLYPQETNVTNSAVFSNPTTNTNRSSIVGGVVSGGDSTYVMDAPPTNLLPPQLPYRDDGPSNLSRPSTDFDPYLEFGDPVKSADAIKVNDEFSAATATDDASGYETPLTEQPQRASYVEVPQSSPSPNVPLSREGSPRPEQPQRASYVEVPQSLSPNVPLSREGSPQPEPEPEPEPSIQG